MIYNNNVRISYPFNGRIDCILRKAKNRILKFMLTAASLIFFIRLALYDGLVVREYPIRTPLAAELHTFVLLTDLHATYYGDNQLKLIRAIERYAPEAVFLAGDIADDKRDFEGAAVLLQALEERYPCYYVTGNHERWVDYTDDIKSLMRSLEIEVLDETSGPVVLGVGKIRLFGLDDPLFYEDISEYRICLNELDVSDETFDLLLAHRPEFYTEYLAAGFDLTLCGHAHGGQVRIPFLLNGLYAPNQGYFPDYAGGLYRSEEGRSMIVSRGLMKDELPRIFNPPEICVIQLIPEKRT